MRFTRKKDYSDAELLALFQKKGQMEALGQLFDRYLEMIYGVCLKYLSSPEDAEDAVMAIFEQLPEKVKKHNIQDFRPWVYVLSKNHCLMQLRKKKIIVPTEPQFMQSEVVLHPFSESEKEQQEKELTNMEKCLEELAAKQKTCVELFYLHGQTYKEIADQQQLPLGTVRSNIQNGRRNLKNCMEERIEKEDHESK